MSEYVPKRLQKYTCPETGRGQCAYDVVDVDAFLRALIEMGDEAE